MTRAHETSLIRISDPSGAPVGMALSRALVKPRAIFPVQKGGVLTLPTPPPGQTWRSYYYAGGQRVAMREQFAGSQGSVYFLLGDHLGSTSVVANQNATVHSRQLYKPWGESRYTYATLPTKRQYTGQYSYVADFGLYYYGARWYDLRWDGLFRPI